MPDIFDLKALDSRRLRARRLAVPGADFLLRHAADDLLERLGAVSRRFADAVDFLTPEPLVADALMQGGGVDRLLRLDRLPSAGLFPSAIAGGEAIPLAPASVDLVVSVLGLQFVNDLPGAFIQVRRALRPDGLFLAVALGGETLTELRQSLAAAELEVRGGAAPRVAPFVPVREFGALLQRGQFALPVADLDRLTIRYADALALMRDLRAMGATNVLRERDRRPLSRAIVARTAAIYAERFSDPDGRIRATFDLVSISGWAPHESQQQPLRPGSARTRLADALKTTERKAGEKTRPEG
ncbi:MAG: methyltransferase domain-containing protein [Bauldia sp.]